MTQAFPGIDANPLDNIHAAKILKPKNLLESISPRFFRLNQHEKNTIRETNNIFSPNMKTVEPQVHQKRRCFDICEPVRFLNDKLLKPVIVHDGIKPITYFLYQFPHEPKFGPEVGDPAYLTPYIRSGKLREGRNRARVKGKLN